MRTLATILVVLGAVGLVLGVVIVLLGLGSLGLLGPRVLASGAGLSLLLAIALLLLEKK